MTTRNVRPFLAICTLLWYQLSLQTICIHHFLVQGQSISSKSEHYRKTLDGFIHTHPSFSSTITIVAKPILNNQFTTLKTISTWQRKTIVYETPSNSQFRFSWFRKDDKPQPHSKGKKSIKKSKHTPPLEQQQQLNSDLSFPNHGGSNSVGNTASMMEKFKKSHEVGIRTGAFMDELSSTTIIGTAANSRVKVFVDGQLRPTGLEIDDSLEGEELTSAILSAMQDAHSKYEAAMKEKIHALYTSLGI